MTEQGPPGFGARLRHTRERAGLTLRQIAETTKLTVRVLEAVEHERIAQLPTGIYRRSVIRAYASEVGLDPEQTLRAFLEQYPDDLPAPRMAPSSPTMLAPSVAAPSRPLSRIISLLGAGVPIVAGVLYFTLTARGDQTPHRLVDLVARRAADASNAWRPDLAPAAGFLEAPPGAVRAVSMMISVSARTVLQVIADGREVLSREVGAGEVVRLEADQEVILVGDNAGAVHFSINGRAGRALGDAGDPLSVRIGRDDYPRYLIQP